MEDPKMKKLLEYFCSSHGWSYGVLWLFDEKNPMQLLCKEVYHEENVGSTVAEMRLQIHYLGEGIVGQAALEQKHRWMILDASSGKWKFNGGQLQIQEKKLEDVSEVSSQFSYEIKTMAVIPVYSGSVLHLGSTKEIFEDIAFIDQTRKLIEMTDSCGGFSSLDNVCLSFDMSTVDENVLFPCMIPSHNSLCSDLSLIYSNAKDNLEPSVGVLSSNMTCLDIFSGGEFTLTREQEDPVSMPTPNLSDAVMLWSNELQDFPDDFLYPQSMDAKVQGGSSVLLGDLGFDSLVLVPGDRCEEVPSSSGMFNEYQTTDLDSYLLSSFHVDISRLFNPSPEHCISGIDCMTTDSLLNDLDASSVSSSQTGIGAVSSLLFEWPTSCLQSLTTDAFDPCRQRESLNVPATGNQLFHGLGSIFASQTPGLKQNNHLGTDFDLSKCNMEVEGSSKLENWEEFLSQVSLENLLDVTPSASCITDTSVLDQLPSSKVIRLEGFSSSCNKIPTVSHAWTVNSRQPLDNSWRVNDLGSLKDHKHESEPGSRIDDRYSMSTKCCLPSALPLRNQKPAKQNKRRAKHEESKKPRPKDRQLIQDRMLELRDIIPGGTKCNQVQLLGKALERLVFLQSLVEYVQKLKLVTEAKKKNDGVTWAMEVRDQNAFCPIRVEDLGHRGLMGIEMLCEDHGFILELANIIRKLGLTILKGVMEVQQDKLCTSFIVEAKDMLMTRNDAFLALLDIMRNSGAMGTTNETTYRVFKNSSPYLPLQASLPLGILEYVGDVKR